MVVFCETYSRIAVLVLFPQMSHTKGHKCGRAIPAIVATHKYGGF